MPWFVLGGFFGLFLRYGEMIGKEGYKRPMTELFMVGVKGKPS